MKLATAGSQIFASFRSLDEGAGPCGPFAPAGKRDLTEVLDEFLADGEQSILRISMEDLPFEHNTRELVADGLAVTY